MEEIDGNRWYWRNTRSLAIGIRLWAWPWIFGAHRSEDIYGGSRHLYAGLLEISLTYSIGNCSSEHWWERAGALSETEAWERVSRTDATPLDTPSGDAGSRDMIYRSEMLILKLLDQGDDAGGFTSGEICRQTGIAHNRRTMAIARANVIVPMARKGWLAPLDDLKPVVFCITDAGRAALKDAEP